MVLPLPPVTRELTTGLEFSGMADYPVVDILLSDVVRVAVAAVSGVQLIFAHRAVVKFRSKNGVFVVIMANQAEENDVLQSLLDTFNTGHVVLSMDEVSESAVGVMNKEPNGRCVLCPV
nr:uncharacterized protein LOC123761698 [Procambarus clarkii]